MDYPASPALERAVVKKIVRRFIPFLLICYFVSYLDKVNVGFASLTMNHALGLTPAQFGFGAGVFFVAYALLEVPSNLILARVGARRWLARIMITWGLVSACTAFIQGAHGFYIVRFILGACEAGFFPGLVFFLSLWFPSSYRARVIGYIDLAIPLSSLFGAPISASLLQFNAMGLSGWQWMFLIEGVPALLLGIAILFWLNDKPEQAGNWLARNEQQWLTRVMNEEARQRQELGVIRGGGVWRTFVNLRVLVLVLVYFGATGLHQAMGFWLPQIIKGLGFTTMQTGFVSALPYLFGAIGMLVFARFSDRSGERKWHTAVAMLLAVAGFAGSALVSATSLKLIAFCVAAFGVYGMLPVFWAIPSAFLGAREAAAGIAYINCLGSLSGLYAPWLIGLIRQETGSFRGGLLGVAATALVSTIILLLLPLGRTRPTAKLASVPGE